jgi:transposase
MKKYIVRLEGEERQRLQRLVKSGKTAAYRIRHAHILLAADASAEGPKLKDEQIARTLGVAVRSVEYLRERFVEEGLDSALERKKQVRPSVEAKLDGRKEAKLVALCCSKPPEGRKRWTLRLLADRLVELEVVESVSHETVRRTLQKTS